MLKCTAVIAYPEHDEKRALNVPVLPQRNERVTFGTSLSSESFVVRQIEYIINDEGNTIAIHIHMEE